MVLFIFGDPQAGTPLMTRYPSLAIDLPLKALVWEAEDGTTWISANRPDFLQARHGLPTPPFEKANHSLFLWSRGGAEYARQTAVLLGIDPSISAFLPKPDVIIDNVEVREWSHVSVMHPNRLQHREISRHAFDGVERSCRSLKGIPAWHR